MNGTSIHAPTLPPPLGTAPDMPARWDDVELDFETAAQRIIDAHAVDGAAHDLPITDLKTWAIAPLDGNFSLVPLARHHTPKPLRGNAFSNLMARIGAPVDFVRRLPAPLQLALTNYLLSEHNENTATLRLRGDEVAAVVSGRYAPLDPQELLSCVRDALVRFDLLGEVRVRGVASGLVDNVRLIFPSASVEPKVGDVTHAGIDISTSSFGRSAVRIVPTLYRLVCRNGLRRPERLGQMAFRHVGDADRLRAAIAEAIPTAVTHARGLMTQWRRAVSFMIDDVQRQIDAMRELTIPERRAFEDLIKLEAGTPELPERAPLYNVVNALTGSAKSAAPARRLELEGLAGDLLAQHVGGPS